MLRWSASRNRGTVPGVRAAAALTAPPTLVTSHGGRSGAFLKFFGDSPVPSGSLGRSRSRTRSQGTRRSRRGLGDLCPACATTVMLALEPGASAWGPLACGVRGRTVPSTSTRHGGYTRGIRTNRAIAAPKSHDLANCRAPTVLPRSLCMQLAPGVQQLGHPWGLGASLDCMTGGF